MADCEQYEIAVKNVFVALVDEPIFVVKERGVGILFVAPDGEEYDLGIRTKDRHEAGEVLREILGKLRKHKSLYVAYGKIL